MSHGTDEISAVHVVIVVKKQATISNIVLAEESLRNSMCDGLISSGRSVVVRCRSPLLPPLRRADIIRLGDEEEGRVADAVDTLAPHRPSLLDAGSGAGAYSSLQ